MAAPLQQAWRWYLHHQDLIGLTCRLLTVTALIATPVAWVAGASPWLPFGIGVLAESAGAGALMLVIWLAGKPWRRKP